MTQKKRGRQTIRTPEIDEKIVEGLRKGIPLTVICREDGMPEPRTVYDWRDADGAFATAIARARDEGEDVIAWECMSIADTPLEGQEVEKDHKGAVIKTKTGDMLGHRKLQIETRLKLLSKFNPKRWGDRQQLEHSGTMELVGLAERMRKRSKSKD